MSTFVVIKIGGKAAAEEATRSLLAAEIADTNTFGGDSSVVLVHGGGASVTEVSKRFGIESVFRDGVRVTASEEMPIVDMVLSGRANKEWVRVLRRAGVDACGVSGADGGLVIGEAVEGSRTAHVRSIHPRLIRTLADAGYVPVVAPASSDDAGEAVNINADEIALELAVALGAGALVFLSDTPGVLRGRKVISNLSEPSAEAEIAAGTIVGGMIPKVRASLQAVARGVGTICIGQFSGSGDVRKLLDGTIGTHIT